MSSTVGWKAGTVGGSCLTDDAEGDGDEDDDDDMTTVDHHTSRENRTTTSTDQLFLYVCVCGLAEPLFLVSGSPENQNQRESYWVNSNTPVLCSVRLVAPPMHEPVGL